MSQNSDTTDDTIYGTDDEVDPGPGAVSFSPIPGQVPVPGVPIKMKVNMKSNSQQSSYDV